MNIDYSAEDLAFKKEVTEWFEANLTPELKAIAETGSEFAAGMSRETHVSWGKTLASNGWLTPGWPVEYGGPKWTLTQRYIFDQVRAEVSAPTPFSMGVIMLGPVIMKFGTDEQKAHYLPRILSFEDWWCQGYSEPGSGSDLASLSLSAESDGDHYVLNGSKIWTTYAQWANKMFCLVRTNSDGKKQEGISFLLLDMDTPGIEVRPIYSIDGAHHLNQTFFDNVRVPKANLVGKENDGWTVAKYLLTHERSSLSGVGESERNLKMLKKLIVSNGLEDDLQLKLKMAQAELQLTALRYTDLRLLSAAATGASAGAESSMLKIKGTELQQTLSELMVEIAGYDAIPWYASEGVVATEFEFATRAYNFGRASTIYGGSTEVQYGVLAKAVLGL